MERNFNKIIEDCLDIDEATTFTTGIDKVRYIPIHPVEGTTYNYGEKIVFVKSQSDAWLRPSKSFLYIEGRLTKADGTPYTKNAQGDYPDITLCNNGPLFLFKDVSYTLGTEVIENFTNPGYVTIMHGLMTKSSTFTGYEQFWALDTYNGSTDLDYFYYPLSDFTAADLPFTAAAITAAEYRANVKKIIPRFNVVNKTAVPNLVDADIPCANAGPTRDEFKVAFKNLIEKINDNIDGAEIPLLADVCLFVCLFGLTSVSTQ